MKCVISNIRYILNNSHKMIKTGYQSPAVDGGEADRQRAAEADAVEVSHEGNDHAPGLEEGEGLRGKLQKLS